jgi:hypothetical protein
VGTTTDTLHVLTVIPAGGAPECTHSATVTVNPVPACSITGTNIICAGQTTEFCGPAGMTTYAWTGPGGFTASTQCTGLISVAGDYNLTITDANGCSSTCSRHLTVNSLPVCPGGSAEICKFAADGTLNTSSFDGPPGMSSYSWTGPGGFTKNTQSTGSISTAGTYHLTVTDANNCSNTCDYTLTVDNNPTVTIRKSDLTDACETTVSTTAGFTLEATAGLTSYAWTRVGGGPGIIGATNGSSITVNEPGTYRVDVTDTHTCPGHASVTIGLCCSDCSP